MELLFEIKNSALARKDKNIIAANATNYVQAQFMFSDDWIGKSIIVNFARDEKSYPVVLDRKTYACAIPNEVMKSVGGFRMSIMGISDNETISTNVITLHVQPGADASSMDNLTILEQVMNRLASIENAGSNINTQDVEEIVENYITTHPSGAVDEDALSRVVNTYIYHHSDELIGRDGASAYEVAVNNGFHGSTYEWLQSLRGEAGVPGAAGASAYEIAVTNGFAGTQAEWLESLHGKDGIGTVGKDGKSAYEIAVENGFSGNETEWLDSLKGQDGESIKGDSGMSAYDIWLSEGNTGSKHDFLLSLKGDKGADGNVGDLDMSSYLRKDELHTELVDYATKEEVADIKTSISFENLTDTQKASLKGEKGDRGLPGEAGVDGKSAYEIAVENGFEGTEEDWLSTLHCGAVELEDYVKQSDLESLISELPSTGGTVESTVLSRNLQVNNLLQPCGEYIMGQNRISTEGACYEAETHRLYFRAGKSKIEVKNETWEDNPSGIYVVDFSNVRNPKFVKVMRTGITSDEIQDNSGPGFPQMMTYNGFLYAAVRATSAGLPSSGAQNNETWGALMVYRLSDGTVVWKEPLHVKGSSVYVHTAKNGKTYLALSAQMAWIRFYEINPDDPTEHTLLEEHHMHQWYAQYSYIPAAEKLLAMTEGIIFYAKNGAKANDKKGGYFSVESTITDGDETITSEDGTVTKYLHKHDASVIEDWSYHADATECQHGKFCELDDGTLYFVSAGFGDGIHIWDLTPMLNGEHVVLYNWKGKTLGTAVWGESGKSAHTFDCVVNYPYIFATMGPSRAAFEEDSMNGTHNATMGLITLNISDLSNITAKATLIDALDHGTYALDGDTRPTRIAKIDDYVFMNNSERGLSVFNVSDPEAPVYLGTRDTGFRIGPVVAIDNGRVLAVERLRQYTYADDGAEEVERQKAMNRYIRAYRLNTYMEDYPSVVVSGDGETAVEDDIDFSGEEWK